MHLHPTSNIDPSVHRLRVYDPNTMKTLFIQIENKRHKQDIAMYSVRYSILGTYVGLAEYCILFNLLVVVIHCLLPQMYGSVRCRVTMLLPPSWSD